MPVGFVGGGRLLKWLLIVILGVEIFLRGCFLIYFASNPLPWELSTIRGVPYVEKGSPLFNRQGHVKKLKPRILVLGDYISIHCGRRGGVREPNYPELLDKKLKGAFEVINTGATFYSLREEMDVLENMIDTCAPDVVVVGHVFNDLAFKSVNNAMVPVQLKRDILQFKFITPLAFQYIKIMGRKRYWLQAYQHGEEIIKHCWDQYNDNEKWSFLRKSLEELKRIQEQRKIRIVFVVIPIFYDFDNEMLNRINNRIRLECERSGVDYVNLLDVFKQYKVMELKEDDGDLWHPNSVGREIMAEEIYKRIAQ